MLHKQQIDALSFLDSWHQKSDLKIALLKGYAGTGKTFLIGNWIGNLIASQTDKKKLKICIAAPTHKALDVLRKKCGAFDVAFMTLDSLLGFKLRINDDGDKESHRRNVHIDFNLIIVDEGSMVNQEKYDALLSKRIKTLFVGDPAQLPPVKEDLSPVFKIEHSFEMTQVVRQAEGNPVISLATFLRDCIKNVKVFSLQDVPSLIPRGNKQITFLSSGKLYDWAFGAIEKFNDVRILAWDNATVAVHNAKMHALCHPEAPLYGIGEKILVNEAFEYMPPDSENEDDEILITNGTTLICTKCTPAENVAGVQIFDVEAVWDNWIPIKFNEEDVEDQVFNVMRFKVALDENHCIATKKRLTDEIWSLRRSGAPKEKVAALVQTRKPLLKLAPFRHSYACTVHKSQGSTYDIAFVDWSSIYRSEDRARLMYVAVTRPSDYLVIVRKS